MLILDQFEELLATASTQVQKYFLNQLEGLLKSDLPITLMLVMRDDFFSRFAKEAPLSYSNGWSAGSCISLLPLMRAS